MAGVAPVRALKFYGRKVATMSARYDIFSGSLHLVDRRPDIVLFGEAARSEHEQLDLDRRANQKQIFRSDMRGGVAVVGYQGHAVDNLSWTG